jgi:predicted hydrolase (HD superfamily)
VVGNWDFDKNGRFNLKTTDSKTITMLKMWRKDALEKLIGDVKKKKLFKHMLNVTPAD